MSSSERALEVALGRRRGERLVVGDRTDRGAVGAGAVVDRDQVAQQRQRLAHRGDARRELRVVHERDEIGVVEEVAQLGLDVAVVHVDRHRAQLVRGEDRLDELVAVEAVDADVVARPDALCRRGDARAGWRSPRAARRSRRRSPTIERDPVGDGVDDVLDQVCDVPGHEGLVSHGDGRRSACRGRPAPGRGAPNGSPSTRSRRPQDLVDAGLRRAALAAALRPRRRPRAAADHRGRDAPGRACRSRTNPIGIGHCGPILVALGQRGAEAALPLADAHRRGAVVPALQRAGRGLRPREPEHRARSATATCTS